MSCPDLIRASMPKLGQDRAALNMDARIKSGHDRKEAAGEDWGGSGLLRPGESKMDNGTSPIPLGTYPLCVRTGEGVDAFLAGLAAAVKARIGVTGAPAITRARHREAVLDWAARLDRRVAAPRSGPSAEARRAPPRAPE